MSDEFDAHSMGAKRVIKLATSGDEGLGPLKHLPGTWANIRPEHRLDKDPFFGEVDEAGNPLSPFDGRGWNLIALPFADPDKPRNYRLLMNQYNEVLQFTTLDDFVPNRGITRDTPPQKADQDLKALDYEQMIKQVKAVDVSISGDAGEPKLAIHHEPGLFLHMTNQQTQRFDIARLATIPHGNAATALGRSRMFDGAPIIPDLSGLPEGITFDIEDAVRRASDPESYLFPYHHFADKPFKGAVTVPGFPGFSPVNANQLLQIGLPNDVVRTTELPLLTDVMEGGIANIPFVERQADASVMHSTFWLLERAEKDAHGKPRLALAYTQNVSLDFFPRFDGRPGLIAWPHISINIMEKIAEPSVEETAPLVRMAEMAKS